PAAASAGTSCLLFCGAGFMPADGAATHAEAAAPPALAGINPAPQVLTPPGQSAAAAAGTSCLLFCGAGFMPADGAATHAKAAAPPALAGINPAPQVLTPPGQSAAAAAGTSCFFLWGRLYAGRRSRDPHQGSDPTRAGRDKPGPTGSHPTRPIPLLRRRARPASFLWGRLYAGRRSRGSRRGVVPTHAFPAEIKKAARRLPFPCDQFSN